MSANDEAVHPWIAQELPLLRASVEAGLPTVGICLGGQLMARALGGRVEKHKTTELGWHEIRLNAEGLRDPILSVAGESPTVYQWHGDTFFPPAHTVALASSRACERQAYRCGERAYGFQFHPEADHQLVHEWLEVEGVEEEIQTALRQFGKKTVQDAATQKRRAEQDETANLQITAAIGTLFRQKAAREATLHLHQRLEAWQARNATLVVEFEGSDQRKTRLRGRISSMMGVGEREFVFFRDEATLLWPLRMGDILSVRELD